MSSTTTQPKVTAITKYSWCDGRKAVSIYIDWPNAHELEEEQVQLSSTARSVQLAVAVDAHTTHKLTIEPLSADITGASLKRNEKRITIKLQKDAIFAWSSLKGTAE